MADTGICHDPFDIGLYEGPAPPRTASQHAMNGTAARTGLTRRIVYSSSENQTRRPFDSARQDDAERDGDSA